jgi:hypothetical protein
MVARSAPGSKGDDQRQRDYCGLSSRTEAWEPAGRPASICCLQRCPRPLLALQLGHQATLRLKQVVKSHRPLYPLEPFQGIPSTLDSLSPRFANMQIAREPFYSRDLWDTDVIATENTCG